MSLIVGVDIGGTFADFVAVDAGNGRLQSLKVVTTPDAPGSDIGIGLARLAGDGLAPPDIVRFVHGTTVGVNTIIQRRGARLALFITDGFTDLLELARLRMPDPYSLFCERPNPLIPREHVFPIRERMSAAGEVLLTPQESDVAAALAKARAIGAEGIVVSFLHAWRTPQHELAVAAMLARLAPDLAVVAASEVWPVIREYERTTTAVLNAYVQPRIAHYLTRIAEELSNAGVAAPLLLTTSIGGTMTAEAGRRDCVGMLLSGTASGVVGASLVAHQVALDAVLTLDVGGTSADVALLKNGEPSFATGLAIGEFPLATTTIAVQSSGQGGGSIVWIDGEGVLQVGPVSAGSTPGPACFGRGGTAMTVTDAALLCGLLGHGAMGFGAITPRRDLAERAARPLAEQLGVTVPVLAEGVLKVAVSGMLIAIEQLLARAGMHASELTLMPFGGAGPMLGAMLAEAAGLRRIAVPAMPGTLCALGAASASIRRDTMRTVLLPLSDETLPEMRSILSKLEAEAEAAVVAMVGPGASVIVRAADLRYKGQSFEITVPLADLASVEAVIADFHAAYHEAFGHSDPDTAVQLVNLRASASRPPPDIRLPSEPVRRHAASPDRQVPIGIGSRTGLAALYRKDALQPGARFEGPAIVTQDDTTVFVPQGWIAELDGFRNIMLEQT
jgi:N-methylhydantoinase A